ncbi:hypothetical protein QYF36_012070 [Acer negundo]|nr:hypothetical protein QYF36_012070 [Acer negundo]
MLMQMFGRLFLSVVLGGLVFEVLVQAQDQSKGCGAAIVACQELSLGDQKLLQIQPHKRKHISDQNNFHVCLVNMDSGTPFISTLGIRPLASTMHKTQSASMNLFTRLDVASTSKQMIRPGHRENVEGRRVGSGFWCRQEDRGEQSSLCR